MPVDASTETSSASPSANPTVPSARPSPRRSSRSPACRCRRRMSRRRHIAAGAACQKQRFLARLLRALPVDQAHPAARARNSIFFGRAVAYRTGPQCMKSFSPPSSMSCMAYGGGSGWHPRQSSSGIVNGPNMLSRGHVVDAAPRLDLGVLRQPVLREVVAVHRVAEIPLAPVLEEERKLHAEGIPVRDHERREVLPVDQVARLQPGRCIRGSRSGPRRSRSRRRPCTRPSTSRPTGSCSRASCRRDRSACRRGPSRGCPGASSSGPCPSRSPRRSGSTHSPGLHVLADAGIEEVERAAVLDDVAARDLAVVPFAGLADGDGDALVLPGDQVVGGRVEDALLEPRQRRSVRAGSAAASACPSRWDAGRSARTDARRPSP